MQDHAAASVADALAPPVSIGDRSSRAPAAGCTGDVERPAAQDLPRQDVEVQGGIERYDGSLVRQ